MNNEGPFNKFNSREYIDSLDEKLLQLLTNNVEQELAPLSVLGLPRFFFRDTYERLCEKHGVRDSIVETFFQSYEKDHELFIAEPIRKVMRHIFARELSLADQIDDYEIVLTSFQSRATSAGPELKGKYEVEIIYLEYFPRPSWAMGQYTNTYARTALQPALSAMLRRLVRAFDDFRRDAQFASEKDLLLHEAMRCTTDPWRSAPSDRIKAISAILDTKSTDALHLRLSEELLKALIKKRSIVQALTAARQLEKTCNKAGLFDWQGLALRYQARAYLLKDDYKTCRSILEKARHLIRDHDPDNWAAQIKILEISADLYRLLGEFEQASEAINACIEYYLKNDQLSQYANAVFKKAKILSEAPERDNRNVIELLKLVEPIFAKMIDPTGRGNLLNMYASCLLEREEFDDEEVQQLLTEAQFEHERGHSESGLINSLILRAKSEWSRQSTDFEQGIALVSEAIDRIEKSHSSDLYGLFNAREVKAKLLWKGMRYGELHEEIVKLKSLNQSLSNRAGSTLGASEGRARLIEQLEANS